MPRSRGPLLAGVIAAAFFILPSTAFAERAEVVPWGADAWRYSIVGVGAGAGFEDPAFDDSAWQIGDAPFGVRSICPLPGGTHWPLQQDLLVRRSFDLEADARDAQLAVSIDDAAQVFVNGVDVTGGLRYGDSCAAHPDFTVSIPDEILRDGQNVLAIRGWDFCCENRLDVQLTAEVGDDTSPPEITVPREPTHVTTSDPAGAAVDFADRVSARDAVDGAVALTCDPPSGSIFSLGTTRVTCTATDTAGNEGSATFDVVVTESRELVPWGAAGWRYAVVAHHDEVPGYETPGFDDSGWATGQAAFGLQRGCPLPVRTPWPLHTDLIARRSFDVPAGTAFVRIDVAIDDLARVFLNGRRLTDWRGGGGDGCGSRPDFTLTIPAAELDTGANVLAVRGFDGGFENHLDVRVVAEVTGDVVGDVEPPAITVPAAPLRAEATAASGASVDYSGLVSASDAEDGPVPVSCTPASGTFAIGTTTVTCTAEDAAGNDATASFDVVVEDTTAPVLTVPDTIHAPATGPDGATVTFAASASDAVGGALPATCSPPSGSTFPVGTTTVTCTAEDAAGNDATASFDVVVAGADDQITDLAGDIREDVAHGPTANRLAARLEDAAAAFAAGNTRAGCRDLSIFVSQVRAQAGHHLTEEQAASYEDAARRIGDAAGC